MTQDGARGPFKIRLNVERFYRRHLSVKWQLELKKSFKNIAINPTDTRTSRFTGGERIDCAIAELDKEKRKVTLSIKLLEEIEKKEALEKYGAEGSGKNLPFSSLSEDLKKKDKKKN